jgi:hypothetical protein
MCELTFKPRMLRAPGATPEIRARRRAVMPDPLRPIAARPLIRIPAVAVI